MIRESQHLTAGIDSFSKARYRQYFEEAPGDPGGDAMILMETQVLMQEVLTDGMAFCSLM